VKPMTEQAAEAAIRVACRELHLPTIAAEAPRIADDATRERLTHRGFLAEVLAAEVDERAQRRKARRLLEAHFPRMKRLEDFDTTVTSGSRRPPSPPWPPARSSTPVPRSCCWATAAPARATC
jgi:DNA replication protein DnaC